jgi:hypothetical protein
MGDQTQNEDFTKDTESDETVVVIDGTDETALPDAVLWGGILELGFGLAPTKVMRDTRLSRTAGFFMSTILHTPTRTMSLSPR